MLGYEGNVGVMIHSFGHKKCRIKVFVMFCYLDGRYESLSHYANVEPRPGNFSKYTGVQQLPNI